MNRQHAHRPEPEQLTPRDALGLLVGMAFVAVLLVLLFSTGPVPA